MPQYRWLQLINSVYIYICTYKYRSIYSMNRRVTDLRTWQHAGLPCGIAAMPGAARPWFWHGGCYFGGDEGWCSIHNNRSIFLSLSLSFWYILSIYLCIYRFIYLYTYIFIYLYSIYLFIYICTCAYLFAESSCNEGRSMMASALFNGLYNVQFGGQLFGRMVGKMTSQEIDA